jgi:hypothetical protein
MFMLGLKEFIERENHGILTIGKNRAITIFRYDRNPEQWFYSEYECTVAGYTSIEQLFEKSATAPLPVNDVVEFLKPHYDIGRKMTCLRRNNDPTKIADGNVFVEWDIEEQT